MTFIPGQRPAAPWSDHHWWGQWDVAAALPNVAGSDAQYNDIAAGDVAWVVATKQLYICTDPTFGAAVWESIASGGAPSSDNPTFIPNPGPAHDADTTAAALFALMEPVQEWRPTATRNINPEDAPTSMAFTVIKTNTAAFGIVINVSPGGGWTTPAGLEADYTLFNSAAAAASSWLIRIDLPNKTVIVTPVS